MHDNSRSSGGGAVVAVVLLLLLIIVLIVVGLGAGFFIVARTSYVMSSPPPAAYSAIAVPAVLSWLDERGRYPLSALDIKDTLEAPVLATSSDSQQVYLAYASQTAADERKLYLSRSTDGGKTFETPREVRKTAIFESTMQSHGKEVKRPVRLVPQLVVAGDALYLGWLEPDAEKTTVFYYVAKSTDGGQTFDEPIRVHESSGARPTYTSLSGDKQGNLLATWLDRRAGVQQPFASVRLAGQDKFEPEVQVYASTEEQGVCPCCPTASLITPDGRAIVAFRNQLDGFRDVYIAEKKLTDEAFGEPQRVVAEPTWKFDGCPHDGPSLATDGQSLFVGWMDAHTGTPRCYVASRPLSGGAFTPPDSLNPTSSEAQGNIKLLQHSPTAILAVWEESAPALPGLAMVPSPAPVGSVPPVAVPASSGRHIYSSWKASDNSGTWTPAQQVGRSEGVFQSRAAVTGNYPIGPYLVWNELDDQGKRIVLGDLMFNGYDFIGATAP